MRKQELDGPPSVGMGPEHFDSILRWAKATMADGKAGRAVLEAQLLGFQRHFLGGMSRDLELISSGGGTRSINLAFEAVLAAQPSSSPDEPLKVLTGNPHLAVERAARRSNPNPNPNPNPTPTPTPNSNPNPNPNPN